MGYTSSFQGQFALNKCLKPEQKAYLLRFSEIRHEILDEEMLKGYPDLLREAVGLPIGTNGIYFTGMLDPENSGVDPLGGYPPGGIEPFIKQDFHQASRQHYAQPAEHRKPFWPPSYYCQWVPARHSKTIEWNQTEKFYGYISWLRFLMDHFLTPWGYELSGEVSYKGEQGEHGRIIVADNEIRTVVDGDSTLSRPKNIAHIDEVKKIYWMTFGAISEAARKALLDADCIVRDIHETPPIVLVGIVYDCNYHRRHGYDDLVIWTTEGIRLNSKALHFSVGTHIFQDQSWQGVPTDRFILSDEESIYIDEIAEKYMHLP